MLLQQAHPLMFYPSSHPDACISDARDQVSGTGYKIQQPQLEKFGGSRVMPALHDAVEKLPARADLHHQVHAALVLVRPLEPRDVGVPSQMVHDLHLPLHILNVLRRSAAVRSAWILSVVDAESRT